MTDIDLSKVELFSSISLDGLTALAQRGTHRTFPNGSVLMRQGDPSDVMYILASGKVQVERTHPALDEPVILAVLGPGEVVGEMGLLDDEPRSATVVATADTEVLELGAPVLAEAMIQFPEVARALLHTLSRRLRSTDELIGHLGGQQSKEAPRE